MTPSRAERQRWTEAYRTVSIRGRYWTRTMLRGLVLAQLRALYGREYGDKLAPFVDVTLDDHAWMIWRSGTVPAFLGREICDEAWTRWYDAGNRPDPPALTK